MRIYPEVKISIGLVAAFLLVVTGTGYAYTNSISAIEHGKSVEKGLELLAALESLLQTVKTTQRAAFDYATTGNTRSLKKYRETNKTIIPHMQFIKELASTDKRRYILLTNLETQVRNFSNNLYSVVHKREKDKKNYQIGKEVRDNIDNRYEFIRGRVIFIESEEKELLEHRITLYEKETEKLFNTFAMLAGLVGLFFLFLLWTLIKYVRTTRQSQEAEQRISQAIFKHAPIGIMILKEDLSVASVNPTIEDYLNSTKVVGSSVLNLIPDIPAEAIDYLDSLTEENNIKQQAKALQEVRVFSNKYFDLMFWPIIEQNNLKGIIVVLVDVTDKVALNHQKELLLNTFTHDLKNPLVGNQYLIQAISKEESLSNQDIEILEQLAQGNEDILLMVNNILDIAKLQSKDTVFDFTEFDIKELLEETKSNLESFAQIKNVSIETDFESANTIVKTDKTMAKHLILNLLTNAIKFSEDKGEVQLNLEQNESSITVKVTDQGPGISDIDQANLFSAAAQGELGRKVPGGTGIGLYLCGQIVQALGGSIKCVSKQNEGATFIVQIPRDHSDTKLAEANSEI